ncbi:hypothetical protein [Flagellimonas sp. 2504JD1-5]
MEIKINDQYWLDMGFDFIDGSIKRLKDEIAKLKTYVETIKIPYTIAAIAESLFLNFKDNWIAHLILLSIPILILEGSKWYLNIATMGESLDINYRNPPQIKRQYKSLFAKTFKKLQNAKKISLIATIAMFLSLVGNAIYSTVAKDKEEQRKVLAEESKIYFDADLSEDKKKVLFNGRFPETETMVLVSNMVFEGDSVSRLDKEFKIGEQGLFFYEIEVPKGLKEVEFLAKYKISEKKVAIIETLEFN